MPSGTAPILSPARASASSQEPPVRTVKPLVGTQLCLADRFGGGLGGGLWNFLECRKEWYKKYHMVNLAILTFSLTLLLFREMNSVLAFVSDAYCVYSSEASASEGEHPLVCRSVRPSVSAPFSSGSWGWPVPPRLLWLPDSSGGPSSCLWGKPLASSLSAYVSVPLSQLPQSLRGCPGPSRSDASRPAPRREVWRPRSRHR